MNVEPHQLTDLKELRRRIRKEANAKQRDRWRAVLLALEGKTTAEIMDKLERSKNFVQRWVYFYRDHGLERIRPVKQTGQPPKLPQDQEQAFLDRLDSDPRILRGADIQEILREQFPEFNIGTPDQSNNPQSCRWSSSIWSRACRGWGSFGRRKVISYMVCVSSAARWGLIGYCASFRRRSSSL